MLPLKWVLYIVAIKTAFAQNRSLKLNNDNFNMFLNNFKLKLEDSLSDNTLYLTKYLEKFNDDHLGRTYFGKLIRYYDMKPKIEDTSLSTNRRAAHKLSAMLPLVFHVGATSTWMILTAIMTVKSVLIGLILLIFKIAVSSAKISSFFTSLKHKQSHHHDTWAHHHQYDHERNLKNIETFDSYSPHWPNEHNTALWPTNNYKTIPDHFKTSDELDPYGGYEYADETNKH